MTGVEFAAIFIGLWTGFMVIVGLVSSCCWCERDYEKI